MNLPEDRAPDRRRFHRAISVIALTAVLGTTVYGDNQSLRRSAPGTSVPGVPGIRESLGRAASAVSRIAGDAATLGVLYGTVLSRMDPGVRRSVLAAVEGVREVCTGHRAEPPITRCATRSVRCAKPPRCNRV